MTEQVSESEETNLQCKRILSNLSLYFPFRDVESNTLPFKYKLHLMTCFQREVQK